MRQSRGKTKGGKWVYGWYCEVLGYHYIIPNDADIVGVKPPSTYGTYGTIGSIEVIPESVGRSTGLKDYYEGDLFKGADGAVMIIEWFNYGFQLRDLSVPSGLGLYPVDTLEGEHFPRIGNATDDPELLEKP